jgi:hypothetical protein
LLKKAGFNLKKNAKDLDTSLTTNILAQLYKRSSIYRNNISALFMEFFFPCVFLASGLCIKLGLIEFTRSPQEQIDSLAAPENSPILFSPYIMNNWTSDMEP